MVWGLQLSSAQHGWTAISVRDPKKKLDTVSGCEDIMHKTVHCDVIYPEKEVCVDKLVAPTVLVSHVQVNLSFGNFPNFCLWTKHELGCITDGFWVVRAWREQWGTSEVPVRGLPQYSRLGSRGIQLVRAQLVCACQHARLPADMITLEKLSGPRTADRIYSRVSQPSTCSKRLQLTTG